MTANQFQKWVNDDVHINEDNPKIKENLKYEDDLKKKQRPKK